MDFMDEDGLVDDFGIIPVAGLAWQMFTQTGFPGFYLLYRNLDGGEERRERSPLD